MFGNDWGRHELEIAIDRIPSLPQCWLRTTAAILSTPLCSMKKLALTTI
ncbi:MAG: hypothetical protein ACI9NC_005272, partial [Verrucomicrobiales bacterium]